MAYSNYLIKIGTYTIPEKYIAFDTYNVLLSTNDLDSYRDANGILHRNALTHKVAKAEFNTPYINSAEFNTLMSNIRAQYSNATEKKIATAYIYIPETDSYVQTSVYVPDITVKIYKKNSDGTFLYEPVRFAFIGY